MYEIMLARAHCWGSVSGGPGLCGSPIVNLRAVVAGAEGTVDHFEMSPGTARVFLLHPEVDQRLSLVESVRAPGTVGGDFLFRGFGRFLVRADVPAGEVRAFGPDGALLGRIVGAIQ